ncbi:hypothetical protein ABZ532_09345 [Streptomyces sp. NPDC019396]|uniref:hypothetical protein n=1 Tax=Streptomyces sp. NPDC019396 TaxID=3154687 RepID=UPI0033EDAF44
MRRRIVAAVSAAAAGLALAVVPASGAFAGDARNDYSCSNWDGYRYYCDDGYYGYYGDYGNYYGDSGYDRGHDNNGFFNNGFFFDDGFRR